MQWLARWLAAAWALGIAVWDWRFRRVPNAALVVAVVVGVGVLVATGRGPLASGWPDSLAGLMIATLVWLPGWLLHRLGAGDVKFAACIGLLLGAAATFEAMLLGAVVLGALSVWAGIKSKPDARLPAAVALSAGMLVRMGWGPIWIA